MHNHPLNHRLEQKTVAHFIYTTYAELKNTSSFAQNGAPIESLAMENTFEI